MNGGAVFALSDIDGAVVESYRFDRAEFRAAEIA
jgi:hypothetical protein